MPSISKRKRSRQSGRKPKSPRTIEQYFAQPTSQQARLANVAHALTAMRTEGLNLKAAARTFHLSPRTVIKYGATGLKKNSAGHYEARVSDRVPRALAILSQRGVREIVVRGSREARKLSKYWIAVEHFLATGDDSQLHPYRGDTVTDAFGQSIPLITDLDRLEHLGSAGVLSFESIYARVA